MIRTSILVSLVVLAAASSQALASPFGYYPLRSRVFWGHGRARALALAPARPERPDRLPVQLDTGMMSRTIIVPGDALVAIPRTTGMGGTPTGPFLPGYASRSYAADLQLTVGFMPHLFAGIEGEFGRLNVSGSNLAGGYGVVGARFGVGPVSLTGEIAAGIREVRYNLYDDGTVSGIVEPRVRGELWLNDVFSVGAIAGSAFSAQSSWFGGAFLAVHNLPRAWSL